jgi:hypothetical protein
MVQMFLREKKAKGRKYYLLVSSSRNKETKKIQQKTELNLGSDPVKAKEALKALVAQNPDITVDWNILNKEIAAARQREIDEEEKGLDDCQKAKLKEYVEMIKDPIVNMRKIRGDRSMIESLGGKVFAATNMFVKDYKIPREVLEKASKRLWNDLGPRIPWEH